MSYSDNPIIDEEVTSEQLPEETGYYSTRPLPRKKRELKLPKINPLFTTLVVGIVIGMLITGFLNSSTLPAVISLRDKLGLANSGSAVTAVQQNLTLQETSAVISAVKKVEPAVVSITASQQVTNYFGQVSNQQVSGGSGFIITADGLILTNKHVVSEQGVTYKVIISDGRVFDATVQAIDPLNDIAVVKINATSLPVVSLGSSDALQVGQQVLAIGNALGEFQNSVTQGIVSATHRSLAPQSDASGSSEQLSNLIQTDAAINPGNSGGPLINLEGQVVGIDTAIASTSGGSVGIGFAISIDDIKSVVTNVIKTGKIVRPYLGIRYQAVNASLKQLNNMSVDYGALVSGGGYGQPGVIPGSPADKAGLQVNDIVLKINNDRIDEKSSLQRLLQKYQVGDTVTMTVQRAGKEIQLKAVLAQQGQ